MKFDELVPVGKLEEAIKEGLVKKQNNHEDDLVIWNYTKQAMYTNGAWDNPAVRMCRGMVVDPENNIVARPMEKFFNWNQPEAGELNMDAPVEVSDKLDGSLGVGFINMNNDIQVATRGSFTSDQATFATNWIRETNPIGRVEVLEDITLLTEIIYPENRIVLNYDDFEGLVVLGAVDKETGRYFGPLEAVDLFEWSGEAAKVFEYRTLAEALAAEPRKNAEGLVVRFLNTGQLVKIKQEDYVLLHRLLFNLTPKTIYTHMVARECRPHIKEDKHWGSFLGVDCIEIQKSLDGFGEDWYHSVVSQSGFPDEVVDWVELTTKQIKESAENYLQSSKDIMDSEFMGWDRRTQYQAVKDHPMNSAIMKYLSNGEESYLVLQAWRLAMPESTDSLFSRSEDVG